MIAWNKPPKRIQQRYREASRKEHREDTVIQVGSIQIGGGSFTMMAGPCSVETESQFCLTAEKVKAGGAVVLRGGAFKPRTSPYSFQGLGAEGIRILEAAKSHTGLPIVTEIVDAEQLSLFQHVDILQVGARNMQNFELLKKLGRQDKPVLLKRGMAATLEELLLSAEYIMAEGNKQVLLCERGIRTFETSTRNTLDLSAIPMLKRLTHLPIMVDPSHGTGIASLVEPMSLAAAAAGADGLLIEVHENPEEALCDGPQALTPEAFARLTKRIGALRQALEETRE